MISLIFLLLYNYCMDVKQIIGTYDKILVGIGKSLYRSDSLPENYTDWQTIKNYLNVKNRRNTFNNKLKSILNNKDYFIITSSWDSNLENIIEINRLFTPAGLCKKLQCYNACTSELWEFNNFKDNINHPKCPYCNSPLVMNIITDAFFINNPYSSQETSFHHWLDQNYNEKLLLLELETESGDTKTISEPFENIATALPNTTLLRINSKEFPIPEIITNSIGIKMPLNNFIQEILSQS